MSSPAEATIGARVTFARTVLVGGALLLGGRALIAAWGLAIARGLGSQEYGVFASVFAICLVFQVAADIGASGFLSREISAGEASPSGRLVRGSLLMQTVLAGIAAAALMVVLTERGAPSDVILSGAAVLLLIALAQVARGVLRGVGFAVAEAGVQLMAAAMICVLSLALHGHLTAALALLVYAGAQLPTIIGAVVVAWRSKRRADCEEAGTLWALFRRSLPFNFMSTVGALSLRADMVIIGLVSTGAVVGRYAAASQVYVGVLALVGTMGALLLPILTRIYRSGKSQFKSATDRLFRLALAAGVVAGAAIFVMAPTIEKVFGEDFDGSQRIIQILSLGIPAAFVSTALGNCLLAVKGETALARIFAIVLAVALISYPISLQHGGPEMLAAAVAAIGTLSCLLQGIALHKKGR